MQGRADELSRDERRWWLALGGVGLGLTLAYALIPKQYAALREFGIYNVVTIGSWLAIFAGVRRYRPRASHAWTMIGLGLLCWSVGDIIWSVYDVARHGVPYPSVADGFYIAGYPLLAGGLAAAVRARRVEAEWKVVLDAAAVTISGLLLIWVYVVRPVLDDQSATTAAKVTSILYPAGDVVLTGVAALLFLGTVYRAVSMQLLLGGLAMTLVADAYYYTGPSPHGAKLIDALYLLSLTSFMLAALHPSMHALTDPHDESAGIDSRKRIVMLGVVLLVPPGVIVVQAWRDGPLYLSASVGCAIALILVALLRFDRMLAAVRRSETAARALSRFSAGLVAADDDAELVGTADRAVGEIVRHGTARVVEPPERAGTPHALVAPVRVEGVPVAEVIADVGPRELATVDEALSSVASQLALALERMRGLTRERELVESLRAQNEELAELDQMKNRFVSSASHELRTPLTSMVGYLELLLAGEAGELNDEQQHFLEIVSRNCDRLNRLVDDVLFVGRADSDRLTLEATQVDVGELVRGEIASQEAAARLKGIELRCDVRDDFPAITGDATRLTQVLDNLLTNAIKFTPAGGTVSATLTGDEEQVRIAVADTGVGIPADEVPRVFDRFFRASTSAVASGTGLGLAIVQMIAKAHGGSVSVTSDVGVGTTFTVELPVHPAAATPIMRATEQKEAAPT
jgi:signal transduction histidine kinase